MTVNGNGGQSAMGVTWSWEQERCQGISKSHRGALRVPSLTLSPSCPILHTREQTPAILDNVLPKALSSCLTSKTSAGGFCT
jgi:hypothetical protein